jgi:hypothetical protein
VVAQGGDHAVAVQRRQADVAQVARVLGAGLLTRRLGLPGVEM